MLDSPLLALAAGVVAFIGYLILKAYYPNFFLWRDSRRRETFVVGKVTGAAANNRGTVPPATGANTPAPPVPAPAAPVQQPVVEEPPRQVSASGPNPPNARPEAPVPPTISPEPRPVDPYDDKNMEAPITDSMRYPELSFGPGVSNTGVSAGVSSGVASGAVNVNLSPFSPEFAQNGGAFVGTVFANDLTGDGMEYATA